MNTQQYCENKYYKHSLVISVKSLFSTQSCLSPVNELPLTFSTFLSWVGLCARENTSFTSALRDCWSGGTLKKGILHFLMCIVEHLCHSTLTATPFMTCWVGKTQPFIKNKVKRKRFTTPWNVSRIGPNQTKALAFPYCKVIECQTYTGAGRSTRIASLASMLSH